MTVPTAESSEIISLHVYLPIAVNTPMKIMRTKAGEHRIKTYNGLVLLEVNNLAGVAEAELVKQQAALLPQTFAAHQTKLNFTHPPSPPSPFARIALFIGIQEVGESKFKK
jgi:hypothetical protein